MAFQRLRMVCISDTHGQTPHLPRGDILIHAGDLCQQGTPEELRKVVKWLEATEFRLKIVVAGNHDACLDPKSPQYAFQGKDHDAAQTIDLLRTSATIHFLEHESKLLRLHNDDGTEVKLRVFGSPYIPSRRTRAFGYAPEDAQKMWDIIPLDADIVVAHTPAKYHFDESAASGAVGCPQLREALWRVRPKLFVCGHIHEGRGVQVVEWDLDSPNVKFKERSLRDVPDGTGVSKKRFKVDLSSRSAQPLRNDGSKGDLVSSAATRQKLRGIGVARDGSRMETHLSTRGQGGLSLNVCTDQEALLGREGRIETCFVNASYVPTRTLSRSHKIGRIFNKPVVVDLDIPLDGSTDEWYANTLLWSLRHNSSEGSPG